ncbi:MAG TPA: hypothetical protein PKD65_19560 [Nitrospira sp.]|jgi:hypothetical protein|nr:hypothetical protein [Nitrospira sp.]
MNSNYTLRFPRTGREAFGHECHFHRRDPDRMVGIAILILCVFVAGMMVGGVL